MRRFIALIALVLLASSAFTTRAAQAAQPQTYYVALDGDDRNAGTLAAPVRSIQHAASLAQAGDTVLVRGGAYYESVTPAHSGRADAPITFRPYLREQVSIRGTSLISSTSWVSDTSGAWFTTWPGIYTSTINNSDQLFYDGVMLNLARWPEERNHDLSHPFEATIDRALSSVATGATTPGPQYSIYRIMFQDDAWDQPDGRWVGAKIWVNTGGRDNGADDDEQDGNGQTGVVVATSRANKQLTIEVDTSAAVGDTVPANFQLGSGSRYYLFDPPTLAGLQHAGSWWHDRSAKRLYLRTPDGRPPSTHSVEVKQRDYAFNLDGKSYITVQGFDIFGATITTDQAAGDGVGNGGNREGSVAPAHHIVLDGIRARYVSHFTDQSGNLQTQWAQASGIILSGANNRIENSEIAWSAGNGLVLIGRDSVARNNSIHDTNYTAAEGGGINLGRTPRTVSQDQEVAFNTVYNSGLEGIEFSALNNSSGRADAIRARIHHNRVHDTVLQSADSGGIKAFGSDGGWVRIDHNVVYNIGGSDVTDKYVFFGIYLDFPQERGEYIIDHNVVYNTAISLNINGMRNVAVLNNTFVARPELGRKSITANGTLEAVTITNLLTNSAPVLPTDGVSISASIISATETTAWFEDATNADLAQRSYQLSAGASAAIDAGADVAPFNDATPPDVGAYEYGQAAWQAGAQPGSTTVPGSPQAYLPFISSGLNAALFRGH